MNANYPFRVACTSPELLAERVTKAPFRVVTDLDELRHLGCQDEGVILPELDKSEPLTYAELKTIAVDLDTPDALRLVKVPQRTHELQRALGRSGVLFTGQQGTIALAGMTTLVESPPGLPTTTINPGIGRYVGLHIDAMEPGQNSDQHMMGITIGEAGRGLTVCPWVTLEVVSEGLIYTRDPQDRLERRQQIRQAATRLMGKVACYTLWLNGRDDADETYEAYANLRPRQILHDGTSRQSTAVQLLDTGLVLAESFESVV